MDWQGPREIKPATSANSGSVAHGEFHLSEVDDTSILRAGLSTPLSLSSRLVTDPSAHAPAQRAGAQRLCAVAQSGRARQSHRIHSMKAGRFSRYFRFVAPEICM
jgi:hypothetical protein